MSTILISGANRGLGLEFARQYAADGWTVLAASRSGSDALSQLADSHANVELFELDVADAASIAKLSDEIGERPIDVLLNNAGFYGSVGFAEGGIEHQAFGDTDYENWAKVMEVNVFAPMRMAETFVDRVAASEQKKVVTLSSMLGSMELNTIGGLYAYRSSKAAVNMVMKSMGLDLMKLGVRAVAMHPGWAKTDMGGPDAEIEPAEGVTGIRQVIAALADEHMGKLVAYDGSILPY